MKKILLIIGAVLVLVLGSLVAIPFFFKDKIVGLVKETINKELMATVDFTDVDISLFRSFPNMSVGLKGLSVVGKEKFEGISLLNCERFDLDLNIMSVIQGEQPMSINKIHLEKPTINILVLKDGVGNYSITKPAEAAAEPSHFALKLNEYSISNGEFVYDDRALDFYFQLRNCNHSGSGDMTADIFDFKTKTISDAMTMRYGGTTYFDAIKTDADIMVNADMKNFKFTLKDNEAKLNDFLAKADGWIQIGDLDKTMDFTFSSPQNDFKNFLSLIPGAYSKDFASVKASGKFEMNGFAKGIYNSVNPASPVYPAFGIHLKIDGADFQYPSLPTAVTEINGAMDIKSPTSNFDNMTVDIPAFKMNVGGDPFAGYFYLKTPISDPDIDTKVKGIINLQRWKEALPLESIASMNGIINADVTAKTRMSYIDKKEYEKVNMAGRLGVQGMSVQPVGKPKVVINSLQMNFTPNYVGVDNFTAQLGKSDIVANGKIDNILAYFSPKNTMKGTLFMRSNNFDASEWMTPTAPTATATSSKTSATPVPQADTKASAAAPVFDRFDFTLDAEIKNLKYDIYNLKNLVAKGNFTPNTATLTSFGTQIGQSDINASGVLNNVFPYLFKNEILGGNLKLKSSLLDLNQFMTNDAAKANTTATSAPSQTPSDVEPMRIPRNIELVIDGDIKKMIYTNMNMDNVLGKIVVSDGVASMKDAKMNTLGGSMMMAGLYDSKKEKPSFDFKYDIQNFDFQQAFKTFNTFQKLAPIGNYITGKFNTNMVMSGGLGKDMMPDFNTLTASGFLQTLQAIIIGLKPVQEISNTLNLKEINPLDIKETKNWFEIRNGAVELKPFDMKVKDIMMNITGTHSLANEMNYAIKTKVPRKMLEKGAVGAAANTGINLINKEASKYGLNVAKSEFVNCLFTITGSITSPKVSFKLLGSDGQTVQDQATDQVNALKDKAVDSLKRVGQAKMDEVKKKAEAAAQKAVDSLQRVVNKKVDDAVNKAKDELNKKVEGEVGKATGELGDKVGEKAKEVLGDKAKEGVDEVKKKLENFNPFKKKGGGN